MTPQPRAHPMADALRRTERCGAARTRRSTLPAAPASRARRASAFVALLVAGAALAPALAARGNWYDPYLDGLAALERGDAEQAVVLFEQALDRRPASGYHRTYGTNFIHYTPHAQLALALASLGSCERALEEVASAEQAGEPDEVQGLGSRLEVVRRDCAPSPAQPTPPAPPAATAAPPPSSPRLADPALLRKGLDAYLAGDLDGAARLFARAAERGPDSAVAPLMLAASLHGAWSTGGRSDQDLHARAVSALERAARRDPHLSPPEALLPPDFLALYRSVQQRLATE